MKEINIVLVVGAGVMGHGFAQVFALKRKRDSRLYARLKIFRDENTGGDNA